MMFDISEDTPTRLVMTLGTRNYHWTKCILDKSTGRARFERRMLIFPRRPIEVPIADVVATDPIVFRADHSVTYYLLLKLRSGKTYWLAGDSGEASVSVAAKIRGFLGLPESDPAANPVPRATRWMMKAVTGLGIIAVGMFVVAQAIRFFMLPACDSSTAVTTATELLQRNSSAPVSLSEARTTATAKGEARCQALLTVASDSATVGYQIFWRSWSPTVQMTGVVGTDKLDPARIAAIAAAAKDFMARAKDAHETGNPPRQSDPSVNTLLTTIFGVSDLAGKTLASADIQSAVNWFGTGDAVGTVYVLAGTGFDDIDKLPSTDAMQQRMQANVVRFADEFGRYVDFQVGVLGAIGQAVSSFKNNSLESDWDNSDIKTKTSEVHSILAQTMGSTLISLAYEGLSDDWRMARLAALTAVAPIAEKSLTPEETHGVRDQALKLVDYVRNPKVQDELRKLANMVAKE